MPKYYVLDTNVLLYSPNALYAFSEHTVVIPEVVIEELDRFKKEASDRGANSRSVSRIIDELRLKGNLLTGVPINELGGILRLESNHVDVEIPAYWARDKADNRILQICKGLAAEQHTAILVTRDTNMRVKAAVLQIQAEDFRSDKVAVIEQQYTGRETVYASSEVINRFHREEDGWIAPEEVSAYDGHTQRMVPAALFTNQFLLIRSIDHEQQTVLGRFDGQKVVQLRYRNSRPFGVTPRNIGQIFMQECLMMNATEAPLVIIKGPAGTAKTFYSLAVGLYKHMEVRPREYHRILICRPNSLLDEGIGYLPGTEADKLEPYMRSIKDNLFTLLATSDVSEDEELAHTEETINMLFEKGVIKGEALAYQRGRSLQKHWVIFDEMQNSTPRQAKTILTRSGQGTKTILLGDPAQIDNPLLDSQSNGLSYASEKMRGSKLCFQVTMLPEECERSPLAGEAALRL